MKKKKYHQIAGEDGADKAYQRIREYLAKARIDPPVPVKVFFCHFDDEAH